MAEVFDSSSHKNDNKRHLLLAASGSVATIKIPNIISALAGQSNLSIRLIFTSTAKHFLLGQSEEQPSIESLRQLPNVDGIYFDEDEYAVPWTRGAKILHIELRRWADLLVVAPLSANTLAKMAGGLCDNLLLSTMRAWDVSGMLDANSDANPNLVVRKHVLVAPAMNTAMWFHPITKQHVSLLENEWGVRNGGWVEVLHPIQKTLACGDTGSGAMHSWQDIVVRIQQLLDLR